MARSTTDDEVRQNILDELRHDDRIDASNISVVVTNGFVHLAGTVSTDIEKTTVEMDARRIKGVVGVQNDVVARLMLSLGDQSIADAVRRSLKSDRRLSRPDQISVSVVNGVVTLSGTVLTYDQKNQAADDAWTTPGASDVVNTITVTPPLMRPDSQIAADVRTVLAKDPSVNAVNIAVSVANGTVSLRGTVPSFFQVHRAASDAWSVVGVRDVVNQVTVSL